MRKFINSFTWAFLIVFSVPSVLIVASWNSLPGEVLYTVKLGLEQSLLFVVSPSVQAKESLQVRYTERRLTDAKRMLSEKHSVEGLPYLTYQINATHDTLVNAPKGETQKELARKYIVTLENASSELEQQKQVLTTSTAPTSISTTTLAPPASQAGPLPTPLPTAVGGTTIFPRPRSTSISLKSTPSISPPAPTVAASVTVTNQVPPTTAATALQITQTQQTIRETIDDLKKITEEENGKNGNKENSDEKKKNNDQKKGND